MIDIKALQARIGTPADGQWGPASRAALLQAFTNTQAPAVTAADIEAIAARLGCSVAQLRAVGAVESGGAAFDAQGRPKILFERHLFHRATGGRFTPAPYSQPTFGGYDVSSWDKLTAAAGKDVDAAFGSASWGKFQVLGRYWQALGYGSAFDLALSTVAGEAEHYEMLARFVSINNLKPALRAMTGDPETCRGFARGYNGPAYERNAYHIKLAAAL